MKRFSLLLLVASAPSLWPATASDGIEGLWNATVMVGNNPIPFRMGLSGGSAAKGWFFNGDDREVSTTGNFENGILTLHFDSYASVLRATVKNGVLDGLYTQRGKIFPIHAVPAPDHPATGETGPDIHGVWYLENVSSTKKDEKAWSLVVRQEGTNVSAAILRVDGDTGTLTGGFSDGRFVLSHFSGARPSQILITPQPDGTLLVELSGQHHEGALTAYRPEVAKAKGLPEPTDANQHTGVKDPSKPFAFSFPDLSGKIVSNTDARFRGKVVLINITGSWCPNCHDEAPFLAELYRKYHDRGLEIVALSFEEAEQLQDPTRLRALIKEYEILYPVLLGGETSSAKEKLTSALDWDSWPTTFFVGRDGLVKAVHAGFAGPASGELYLRDKAEFVAKVEELLSADRVSSK
ncbi:MAG TPA: TlpA disulfide reductase family protein [Bryobacteraceae bacterium]|nr:TlpA disulfide reductase family protein [Bryobacteraceae bacterium]